MKRTTFKATYHDGTAYRWAFYRDPVANAWFLVTHDGCERWLGVNWADAVPRIRSIAEGYGMVVGVS